MPEALFVHPEAREGEVFLTNLHPDDDWDDLYLQWKTARKGGQAYDLIGRAIPGTPIFVQQSERDKAWKQSETPAK
jgi:hypothetical protein